MSIFTDYKDILIDYIEDKSKYNLEFPLNKTGSILNNYTRGDFIVVGGRKTSGKSSFMLHNYVISPIIQKIKKVKTEKDFNFKITYINARKSDRNTIEKMVVNYIAQKTNNNKLSVASFYSHRGATVKLATNIAAKAMSDTINIFEVFLQKGFLTVKSKRQTMYQVERTIINSMKDLGTFENEDTFEFTYFEDKRDVTPIVVIDDASSIIGENGRSILRMDSASTAASTLRHIAKALDIVIVLGVPSMTMGYKNFSKQGFYKSAVTEIDPYGIYADRVILLHNPVETDDVKVFDYDINHFINNRTGVCYFRMAYIGGNYMGPTGVTIPYLFLPENGSFRELPSADDLDKLDDIFDIIEDVKHENKKENNE